jgi:hypothetical protein
MYIENELTEFWKRQGVVPIKTTPCESGEGFSWSEFINGLSYDAKTTDRRVEERDR